MTLTRQLNRLAGFEMAHGAPRRRALVAKAHQTAAHVCFIEDLALLEPYGGVAATLRFRM